MPKKPVGLIYAVDDVPPPGQLLLLGLQHAILLSVYLVLIVIVFRAADASREAIIDAVSLGMIASAVGVMLQALRGGPIGSGFLAAPVFSAIYLGPSLLAANAYGLAAVFGMTIFAGLVEIAISRLLSRLRIFFPPAISGFIVAIVGINLGLVGIGQVLDVAAVGKPQYGIHIIVSLLTLATIIGLSVWAGGMARLLCSSIGIAVGFAVSVAVGLVTPEAIGGIVSGEIVRIPLLDHVSYAFEWELVPGFLIAGIAAALRTVGVVTTCQKINDDDWKHPDSKSIKGGMLADGLGCVVAGLLGGIGQNSGPSLVGVSKASGATSRSIAFAAGGLLILFAFFPIVGAFLLLLPKSVVGAALVFTACFMITGGIQIIVSRNIDARMTYVIGIALLFGLSREVYEGFYRSLPAILQPITNTVLTIGVTTALFLHLIFRIGSRRTASVTIENPAESRPKLHELLKAHGESWGIESDILERAEDTTTQVLSHIRDTKLVNGEIDLGLTYNELDLVIKIDYAGTLLSLPNVGVRRTVLLEEESFSYGLADFLIAVYPDRMEAEAHGNTVTIRLIFTS